MLTRFILEALLQLIFIVVPALLLLKHRNKRNYLRIVLFSVIYIVYQIVLVLPTMFEGCRFIESGWNWEGKIFAIAFGLLTYFIFMKHFAPNNFFTLKQNPANKKKTWIVCITVIILMSVLYYFIAQSEFDLETLAFQLTMPAIDEEIMFRVVLLGLLLTSLPEKVPYLANPSILLTGVLFGLLHALTLTKEYHIRFDLLYFIHTGAGGYVFGWLAVKSRSVALPVLTHGGTNFLAALATMLH